MITDPRLILLDEPTSGLDSATALKICKMLKKETKHGMTVMCTIHQPSSELFQLFDRLILLHDGKIMYQGPVAELVNYLNGCYIPIPKFKNIADHIITLVQDPSRIREGLTTNHLAEYYDRTLRERIYQEN